MEGTIQLSNKMEYIGGWIKKRWLLCLLIVDLLLGVLAGIKYWEQVSDLKTLDFSKEQLQEYTEDRSIGGTIDESSGSGLYDIIPDMFLEKGYYDYTVYYEGNSEGSFCWPHTYVEFYDVIEQELVYLDGEHTEGSRRFWLNADLNIALRLSYNGEGSVTFIGFTIEETPVLANIELFTQLMLLIGLNFVIFFVVWEKKHPMSNSAKYSVVALIAIALMASYPSLTGYILDGHDLRFHLARIEGIKDGLLSGQFPVRISPTFYNGYGYANSIFYGEVFLYFPALLRVIGFSVTDSYNAFLIALNGVTTLVCYYSSKKIFSNNAVAVVTTLLYVWCPYRLMDIYTRAAVGEVTAMTFLPLIAYGVYRILAEETDKACYKYACLPLAFGVTGIIQSHVITCEMAGGVILLACVLCCFRTLQKKRFIALVKSVIVTILLNAWFLVPFVDFMLTQDIRVFAREAKTELIQTTGLYLPQLFSIFSDFALLHLESGTGMTNEMPISMGAALGLGMILFLAMLWVNDDEQKWRKRQGACFMVLAFVTAWMATLYFPWDRISTSIPFTAKLISTLQFTWRFLGVASALAAVVTGFGLLLLYKKEGRNIFAVVTAVIVVLAIIPVMDYSHTMLYNKSPFQISENSFVVDNNAYYAMSGEYVLSDVSYETVTEIFEPRSFEGVQVTEYEKAGTNIVFSVTNDNTEGYVFLPLLNYKGYKLSSEDNVITNEQLQTGERAVIRVNIPANYEGTISVSYQGFWYWRIAELISIVTAGGLIYFWVKDLRKGCVSQNAAKQALEK